MDCTPQKRKSVQCRRYQSLIIFQSSSRLLDSSTTMEIPPQSLAPLYQYLKSSTSWQWTATEQQAFRAAKQLLPRAPVLVHYDAGQELVLAWDILVYRLGVVLSHRFKDESEHPIGYVSWTLSSAEKNYSQPEKEGLACVFGVHSYLFGVPFCYTQITSY